MNSCCKRQQCSSICTSRQDLESVSRWIHAMHSLVCCQFIAQLRLMKCILSLCKPWAMWQISLNTVTDGCKYKWREMIDSCSIFVPFLWRSCMFWWEIEIQSRLVCFSVSGPQKLDPLEPFCSRCCCTSNSGKESKTNCRFSGLLYTLLC